MSESNELRGKSLFFALKEKAEQLSGKKFLTKRQVAEVMSLNIGVTIHQQTLHSLEKSDPPSLPNAKTRDLYGVFLNMDFKKRCKKNNEGRYLSILYFIFPERLMMETKDEAV